MMLVSPAKIALRTEVSARRMMDAMAEISVTLVRTKAGTTGLRCGALELMAEQRRAVKVLELQRWAPTLFHV